VEERLVARGGCREKAPDGMQRLFTTALWDQDLVRGCVTAALGDPDGVLIGDDTGFEHGGSSTRGSTVGRNPRVDNLRARSSRRLVSDTCTESALGVL